MTADLPPLDPATVHVWRVALDQSDAVAEALHPVLSAIEAERAARFYTTQLRTRYTIAHAWTRRILSHYVGLQPRSLEFVEGEHGKPALAGAGATKGIHFNLSHSGALALVAVSGDGPVGVDVERWDRETDHLELAERFFSPAERDALRAVSADRRTRIEAFFAAWTRKEAYIKATGEGISRGLASFDVSLTPGAPARLLADRKDVEAPHSWSMQGLTVAAGYSGAVVARAPLRAVVLLDAR